MPLTPEERDYDWHVTIGRGMAEEHIMDRGITVGILRDYLVGDIESDYCRPSDDLYDLYLRSVAEGYRDQRFGYTAEELFVWAHEFDDEEGLLA